MFSGFPPDITSSAGCSQSSAPNPDLMTITSDRKLAKPASLQGRQEGSTQKKKDVFMASWEHLVVSAGFLLVPSLSKPRLRVRGKKKSSRFQTGEAYLLFFLLHSIYIVFVCVNAFTP